MDPSSFTFGMENLVSNIIGLASQPLDPNVLPAFLEQITGQRWERVRREGTSETASAPDQSILNSRHSSSSTAAAAAGGGSVRVRGTNIDRDTNTNINNNAAGQQEERIVEKQ